MTIDDGQRETEPVRAADASAVAYVQSSGDSASLERTELSWSRAGLSVIMAATLLIKHAIAVGGRPGLVLGVAVLAVGALLAAVPVRRHLVSADRGATRTGAVRAAAAVSVGIGLLSFALLLVPDGSPR